MINSKIEWTDHTANLWWGCQEVHEGCDNCYARVMDNRWKGNHWGAKVPRRAIKSVWRDLDKFQCEAKEQGTVKRVFVGSMMDIFEKPMPIVDAKGNPAVDASDGSPITTQYLRDKLFDNISKGCYPNLFFLLLTKRPGNIMKYIPEAWKKQPPANVMYGTSIVNQTTADEMIPKLLQVPGKHFLSMEPLLGPVNIGLLGVAPESWGYQGYKMIHELIDWVIVGGESGHGARPVHPEWVNDIRKECDNVTAFFFKQWGEWMPINKPWESQGVLPLAKNERWLNKAGGHGFHGEDVWRIHSVGKHKAGRLLYGESYSQLPIWFDIYTIMKDKELHSIEKLFLVNLLKGTKNKNSF